MAIQELKDVMTEPDSTTGKRRDVRRLAMQVLYQLDVSGESDRQILLDGLDTEFDKQTVREQGVDLALNAVGEPRGGGQEG